LRRRYFPAYRHIPIFTDKSRRIEMKMTEYFKGHPVVLASGSPRRKELLEQIGIKARIRPSVQEEKSQAETPEELVMELAAVKAQDIAAGCESGTLVIGADTVTHSASSLP
jgi:septum formation protein